MNNTTLEKSNFTSKNNSIEVNSERNYQNIVSIVSDNYFGLLSMFVVVGSLFGAIATMYIFQNKAPFWQFEISVIAAMANLVTCLAQSRPKWLLNIFLVSITINMLLLLTNYFA